MDATEWQFHPEGEDAARRACYDLYGADWEDTDDSDLERDADGYPAEVAK